MDAPLACPICGRPPLAHQARWDGERSTVECRPCRLVMGSAPRESLDALVARWNARPTEKAPT